MATIPAFDPSAIIPGTQQNFEELLEQSRDLITERLDQAVGGMLGKAKDALSGLIETTRNFEERRLYEEARDVVVRQRGAMEKQFRASYLEEFRRRSDRARKIAQSFGESDGLDGQLSLVGADDFDETLKFNSMAAKLRAYCDEELVALDQRVGVLLGDANLGSNDNPFSPQVICDAYKQACRSVDTGVGARRVLLKLFDDHVLDDVRSMYKAVNALLVQNSILPKIRYSVSRSQGKTAAGGAPGQAEAAADAPKKEGVTTTVAQDLFTILQNLAANNAIAMGRGTGAPGVQGAPGAAWAGQPGAAGGLPAGAGGAQVGAGGGVLLQGPELQQSLTRIQLGDMSGVAGGNLTVPAGDPGTTNVLRELRSTSVAAGMASMDVMTLDIIAMLFDQLFDDPKVPNGVKGLIGRLQIPMLKVAIADKTFFSTKTHPARRLLDTLGEVAMRLPPDFSPATPLFARLQGILEELVEHFRDSMEIFASVRERVEALLIEEDERIEQERQAAAKRAEEMENLAVARRVAENEVKARIQSHSLPAPVIEFLGLHWLKLLLLIHVREGKDSEGWTGALEAMDLLIYTIEPKASREERRKVVGLIPGLLKKLAVGLKAAGIDGYTRTKFFTELMKYHRHSIAGADDSHPPQSEAEIQEMLTATSPEATAAAAASLDFTAPITIANPYGEGEVKVESLDLDFTALEPGAQRPLRDAADVNPLDNLTVGKWVAFRESAEQPIRRPARLIFVSPKKTRYLFALDRAGKDILQCTPAEMTRRFRLGDAVFIDEPRADSLFDRIMKGLIGKLRTPGAQAAT